MADGWNILGNPSTIRAGTTQPQCFQQRVSVWVHRSGAKGEPAAWVSRMSVRIVPPARPGFPARGTPARPAVRECLGNGLPTSDAGLEWVQYVILEHHDILYPLRRSQPRLATEADPLGGELMLRASYVPLNAYPSDCLLHRDGTFPVLCTTPGMRQLS